MTSQETRSALLEALSKIGDAHPQWRLGQTLANLAMAAGRLDPGGVWDLEDDEALDAAQELLKTVHVQPNAVANVTVVSP